MSELYITAAQPNPPGRDVVRPGYATDHILNQEWIEFEARQARNLIGDRLSHFTFDDACRRIGSSELLRFDSGQLAAGQKIRVHTGRGSPYWEGATYHMFLNRSWFVWNNRCGDRASLTYDQRVIDSAYYEPSPPEGALARLPGTDRLLPARVPSRW